MVEFSVNYIVLACSTVLRNEKGGGESNNKRTASQHRPRSGGDARIASRLGKRWLASSS